MKKTFLFFAFAMVQTLVFGQKNFLDLPYIETSAKVDTLIMPDKIFLSIIISEADSKNKKSVESQEKEMEKALKTLNINTEKDLVVQDLTSNFRNYFLKGQNVLKTKRYELLVSDAMAAGKVLIALESLGISNANINRTEYSKSEELILELKSKAVAKTKKIAEKLVKPLGQKVGKAVHISEFGQNGYNQLQGKVSGIRIRGVADPSIYENSISETPIFVDFKKLEISAEISVKYILE